MVYYSTHMRRVARVIFGLMRNWLPKKIMLDFWVVIFALSAKTIPEITRKGTFIFDEKADKEHCGDIFNPFALDYGSCGLL